MVSNPFQCLTLSLLIIPPLILATYFFASFPNPPEALPVYSSLAGLPNTSRVWDIYPETFYDGGAYVKFPYGRVRYWLLGPETGKKVTLIHGLSVPSIVWKDVAPRLASHGFRVLLYDLYGRGYSDAPQTTYDVSLYVTQLALLMQHVKWEQTRIVGVSMGGAIAASFTAQFPQLVASNLALISCAGLIESSDMSRTVKIMASPLVQAFTGSFPFRKYIQHLTNSTTGLNPDPLSEVVRIQSAHLSGFNAAVASSLRDGPIRGQQSSFEALKGRRVLLFHGTKDTTVPYKYAPRIQSLIPLSELITIEGGKHDLTVTHTQEVVAAFVRWFSDDNEKSCDDPEVKKASWF